MRHVLVQLWWRTVFYKLKSYWLRASTANFDPQMTVWYAKQSFPSVEMAVWGANPPIHKKIKTVCRARPSPAHCAAAAPVPRPPAPFRLWRFTHANRHKLTVCTTKQSETTVCYSEPPFQFWHWRPGTVNCQLRPAHRRLAEPNRHR